MIIYITLMAFCLFCAAYIILLVLRSKERDAREVEHKLKVALEYGFHGNSPWIAEIDYDHEQALFRVYKIRNKYTGEVVDMTDNINALGGV